MTIRAFLATQRGTTSETSPGASAPAIGRLVTPDAFSNALRSATLIRHFHAVQLRSVIKMLEFDPARRGAIHRADANFQDLEARNRTVLTPTIQTLEDLETARTPCVVQFFRKHAWLSWFNFAKELFAVKGFDMSCFTLDVMHIVDLGRRKTPHRVNPACPCVQERLPVDARCCGGQTSRESSESPEDNLV